MATRKRDSQIRPIRVLLILAFAWMLVLTACEKDQQVKRIRPPATNERATLPPPPNLEPTAGVVRYPDGSYSVDGFLREATKLVGKKIRVKGYVREVTMCDPETDSACAAAPHAYLVDDTNRPGHALLVVGPRRSVLANLQQGRGEQIEGTVAQISPDGRFVRARGMLVLPELPPPPPPPPVPTPEEAAPAAP